MNAKYGLALVPYASWRIHHLQGKARKHSHHPIFTITEILVLDTKKEWWGGQLPKSEVRHNYAQTSESMQE